LAELFGSRVFSAESNDGLVASDEAGWMMGVEQLVFRWSPRRGDPNGKVLAAFGGVTHVITYGGGTQMISGIPGGSQLEDAADPRWLFEVSNALGVYSKTGATLDAPLPGYMRTTFLDDWASSQWIPFVFGWTGTTLLYPSDVLGTSKVAQDLIAKAGTTSGRIGDAVTHYRLTTSPARIYFTAGDGSGLFWVPRP
jgi:hypothetical protein